MKTSKFSLLIIIIAFAFCSLIGVNAQEAWVAESASKLVAALIQKGGQQEADELAKIGGEALANEALENAAREGGTALAQRLANLTLENGAGILKVAAGSPSQFISAFDELTPTAQKAVAQAINREPDLMARLFSDFGKDALTAAAQHPGVGTKVMQELGQEGADTLRNVTTDQAIQLCRLAPQLAKVEETQRKTIMEMIGQAPGHVLDLLESHPKVLLTGAGVASFIAAKEQILGGYDIATDENGNVIEVYKPGFIQRMWEFSSDKFKTPLSGLIGVLVLIILLWGCIKLWAIFRIERSKVHMKESELIHTKGK